MPERRVRDLPARVAVYLVLAGCLFAELGYSRVWGKLTAGIDGLALAAPSASALTQARQRLGPGPLRALFHLLRGPSPAGARWHGLLVVAIDGAKASSGIAVPAAKPSVRPMVRRPTWPVAPATVMAASAGVIIPGL